MNRLRISVVVPVYNEADYIVPCLNALLAQTIAPDEIIVVDNNSTDATCRLVARFGEQVRLLHEPRQGLFYSRECGLDAATGEVVGRIDADTIVGPDWVATLHREFADAAVVGASGPASWSDMPCPRVSLLLDRAIRRMVSGRSRDARFLYGANMAVRRSAWRQVRREVCNNPRLHEDLDLSHHLREHGGRLVQTLGMAAGVSARRMNARPKDFIEYMRMGPRTYRWHGRKDAWRIMSAMALLLLSNPLLRFIWRVYDPRTRRVSLTKAIRPQAPRSNPMDAVQLP